jgi:beta-lactamase regulating signal transducer with metallopeptidase domain
MNPAVANHLWQSTIFAVAVALLTLAFRKNRAEVRYWLWWSASVKFLLPFGVLINAVSHIDIAPAAKLGPPDAASVVIFEISRPFVPTQQLPPSHDWRPAVFLAAWALGSVLLATHRIRDYLRLRSALRSAMPLPIDAPIEVRCTAARLEPGIAGFWRPILLLPAGLAERLTPRQLDSILVHEFCHARRRDNLTAAVHMLVETFFWFHPLVWWIGARLIEERERACDEAVIDAGGEQRDYADAIVSVCKHYVESPIACVSGVTGANIKKRLRGILIGAAVRDLSLAQKLSLALVALAALGVLLIAGMVGVPALRAQAPSGPPKLEVASVRPCRLGDTGGDGRKTERKTGDSGGPINSPGRLTTGCDTVENLIRSA